MFGHHDHDANETTIARKFLEHDGEWCDIGDLDSGGIILPSKVISIVGDYAAKGYVKHRWGRVQWRMTHKGRRAFDRIDRRGLS